MVEDLEHIAANINMYGRQLMDMVPVVTSHIRLLDSRRSLEEAAGITRLTYLALVFVPLSFVSGVFSVQDSIASGGKDVLDLFCSGYSTLDGCFLTCPLYLV